MTHPTEASRIAGKRVSESQIGTERPDEVSGGLDWRSKGSVSFNWSHLHDYGVFAGEKLSCQVRPE
jgi:hypothetical protein